jgi:hypothetical protein
VSEQERRTPARLMYLSREAGHHSHELQDALRQAAEDREAIEAIAASRSLGNSPFAIPLEDGILVWFGNEALGHSQQLTREQASEIRRQLQIALTGGEDCE